MDKITRNTIFIETGFENFRNLLETCNYSVIHVIVDENTERFCLPLIKKYIGKHSLIKIKSGEANKNIDSCIEIWNTLSTSHSDRKSLVINLGGGVICDMGGFAAATFKRGIDFIHIPTTLLAMCDASIGGKLGVDLDAYKNLIGLYQNPKAIIINTGFLKTLHERHILSGFAEVIKHAIIKDKLFFEELCTYNNINDNFNKIVSASIKIKTSFIKHDFYEKGMRKSLNFGHSIGHALETYSLLNDGEKHLYHGEAVAAGMIMESYISYSKGMLTKGTFKKIEKLISRYFDKINIRKSSIAPIISLILQDKKNENNKKLFSLLNGIGKVTINEEVKDDEISKAFEYYMNNNA